MLYEVITHRRYAAGDELLSHFDADVMDVRLAPGTGITTKGVV